jgi:hypothetical protein
MTGGLTATIHHERIEDCEKFTDIWYSEIKDQSNNVIYSSPKYDTESLARYGIELECKLKGYKITKPYLRE